MLRSSICTLQRLTKPKRWILLRLTLIVAFNIVRTDTDNYSGGSRKLCLTWGTYIMTLSGDWLPLLCTIASNPVWTETESMIIWKGLHFDIPLQTSELRVFLDVLLTRF